MLIKYCLEALVSCFDTKIFKKHATTHLELHEKKLGNGEICFVLRRINRIQAAQLL